MKTSFFRNAVAAVGIALSVLAAVSFSAVPALAAAVSVNDQLNVPIGSSNPSNTTQQSEALIQSVAVTGGNLYYTCYQQGGPTPQWGCSAPTFVPSTVGGGYTRFLALSDARLDSGIISTSATGSSTSYGVARTAGTSYALLGAATSSSAVTTKAMWETNVASTYVSGAVIPIVINTNYTGSGTLTAASTTINIAVYTEVGGVETAITGVLPASAQQISATPTNYTFSIPASAGLVVGQHIVVEATMVITTASGANTGQINSVGLTM